MFNILFDTQSTNEGLVQPILCIALHKIGRKISKIRELRGMKQEALAAELGISQQAVSKIEQSAEVEEEALQKIAKVLAVTV
jgi:DNA-binding XRE family transcriptional regulator